MGAIIPFRQRTASRAVIGKLVELGYLRPAKRYEEGVVKNAMARLRQALQRDGFVGDGDLSRALFPAPRKVPGAAQAASAPWMGRRGKGRAGPPAPRRALPRPADKPR